MQHLSFFHDLPQYLKKELVRFEKRTISIITSRKCNSATEVLEHYYVLCSRLFDNIVSDPNHKLKALLPPDYDNSRYKLRRQRLFNMPKLCTNRAGKYFYICDVETVWAVVLSHLFMLCILTYFDMNVLYGNQLKLRSWKKERCCIINNRSHAR